MPLTSGTRIGSYQILGPLGAGGMGEVYRATDTRLGRDVALKVLPETLARDAEWLARFEHEGRIAAALNQPNIVTLHSIEEVGGVRFLTREFVDGQVDRAIGIDVRGRLTRLNILCCCGATTAVTQPQAARGRESS